MHILQVKFSHKNYNAIYRQIYNLYFELSNSSQQMPIQFQPFPILIVTLFTPQSKETQPVCLFVEILVRPFSSFSL